MREPLDVLVFYVPVPDTDHVLDALLTVLPAYAGMMLFRYWAS